MYDFNRNRKLCNMAFNVLLIGTVGFMLIAPLFGNWFKSNYGVYQTITTVGIITTIVVTFFFSRYKKATKYVDKVFTEINDCGCYLNSNKETDLSKFTTDCYNNLGADFFNLNSDIKLSGRFFEFVAQRKKETLYFAKQKKLTKDDFFEFSDIVNTATASSNVRQKQTVVLAIVAEKIDEEAIAYSKMTTELGKVVVYPLLISLSNNRAYFLNDNSGKINFALKNLLEYKDGKIENNCKVNEKFQFQKDLENRMQGFGLKAFRDGTFNPRA